MPCVLCVNPLREVNMPEFRVIVLVLSLVMFVGAVACGPMEPPVAPVPEEACAAMCERFVELDCLEGKDTPGGKSCMVRCRETESSGFSTMHPHCVPQAQSCEEARRLTAEGCQ